MRVYNYKNEHGFGFYDMKHKPTSDIFWTLHHHEFHEVILFLNGNAQFVVEGNHYPIKPYDLIFTRNSEMHNIQPTGDYKYEAIVFEIHNNFFNQNNCERYKNVFLNRPLGTNNFIPAELVKKYRIDTLAESMAKYIEDESDNQNVAKCKVTELLYLLNIINHKMSKSDVYSNMLLNDSADYSKQIRDIILYINEHIREDLNLNKIAEIFYISKSHLCHSFKVHTGFTVNKYITLKRMTLTLELADQGHSWLDASVEAGFGNYSNFYKAFKKTYGASPTKQ